MIRAIKYDAYEFSHHKSSLAPLSPCVTPVDSPDRPWREITLGRDDTCARSRSYLTCLCFARLHKHLASKRKCRMRLFVVLLTGPESPIQSSAMMILICILRVYKKKLGFLRPIGQYVFTIDSVPQQTTCTSRCSRLQNSRVRC